MNKILQTSKKLFKFTISRAFFLCLGIGFALVVYKIQAMTVTTPNVSGGNTLTATNWNKIVTDLNALNTDIANVNSAKAPSASPSFTGTATFSGDIVANSNSVGSCTNEPMIGLWTTCPAGTFVTAVMREDTDLDINLLVLTCCKL